MEAKNTSLKTLESARTIENTDYFKYIFKKTEKIVCAVFYILRSDTNMSHSDPVVIQLEDTAMEVLDVVLHSLKSTKVSVDDAVREVRFSLIELESRLRIAHSAHCLSADLLHVFLHEIDSVYRSIKRYSESDIQNPLGDVLDTSLSATQRKTTRTRTAPVAHTYTGGAPEHGISSIATGSRRDRIIEVLRDNPHATIKDISGLITDCGEKTIQRELIAMIKDNIIIREGERRWSKYSLV